jgi:hypothetical protein
MARKSNQLNSLPDWFKLDNYDELQVSEDEIILSELEKRIDLLREIYHIETQFHEVSDEILKSFRKYLHLPYFNYINNGIPQVTRDLPRAGLGAYIHEQKERSSPCRFSFEGSYVKPLTVKDVIGFTVKDKDSFGIYENEEEKIHQYLLGEFSHVDKTLLGEEPQRRKLISLTIDLENATDDEIKSELFQLIDIARKEMNIKKPIFKVARSGDKAGTLAIIRRDKMIALADLIIWEKTNNSVINREVIARQLYPERIVTGKSVREDYIPRFLEYTNPNFKLIPVKK